MRSRGHGVTSQWPRQRMLWPSFGGLLESRSAVMWLMLSRSSGSFASGARILVARAGLALACARMYGSEVAQLGLPEHSTVSFEKKAGKQRACIQLRRRKNTFCPDPVCLLILVAGCRRARVPRRYGENACATCEAMGLSCAESVRSCGGGARASRCGPGPHIPTRWLTSNLHPARLGWIVRWSGAPTFSGEVA